MDSDLPPPPLPPSVSRNEGDATSPVRIGGWLRLSGFGLVLGCVIGAWAPLSLIIGTVCLFLGELPWDNGNIYLLVLTSLKTVFYAWRWQVTRRFFRRLEDTPSALTRFLTAKAAASVCIFLFGLAMKGSLSGTVLLSNFVVDGLSAAIWIPYLRRSRRVRDTFTVNAAALAAKQTKSKVPRLLDVPKIAFGIALGAALFDATICLLLAVVMTGVKPPEYFTTGFFLTLGSAWLVRLALVVALYPGGKPAIFFLRAFKGDAESVSFRRRMEAVLGPDQRLAGIRCPRRRPSWIFQVFQFPVVALRYAGSDYFELEAGSDWLLRLNTSLAASRGAILDARQHTEGVGHEISLCARAMGPDRCAVLIDADMTSTPETLRELEGATLIPVKAAAPMEAIEKIRAWAQRLPGSPAGARDDAWYFAKEKSPAHLSRSLPLWYRQWFRICMMAVGTVGFGTLLLCGHFFASGLLKVVSEVPLAASEIVTYGLGALVVYRRIRQGMSFREMNPRVSAFARWRKMRQPVMAMACVAAGLALHFGLGDQSTIRGGDGGYSVTLSGQWTYLHGQDEWDLVAREHLSEPNAVLKVATKPREGHSTSSHAQEWKAEHPALQWSAREPAIIDGRSWEVWQREDTREHGEVWRTMSYFCADGDRRLTMEISALAHDWEGFHGSLNRTVNSFRFADAIEVAH